MKSISRTVAARDGIKEDTMRCTREMNTCTLTDEGVLDGVSATVFGRVTTRTIRAIPSELAGRAT